MDIDSDSQKINIKSQEAGDPPVPMDSENSSAIKVLSLSLTFSLIRTLGFVCRVLNFIGFFIELGLSFLCLILLRRMMGKKMRSLLIQ